MNSEMESRRPENTFLRTVLRANAVFSGISGALLLSSSLAVSSYLGVSSPLTFLGLGGILMVWAAFVYWASARDPLDRPTMSVIALSDFVWVVGSGVLLLTGWAGLSIQGNWAVGIVAAIVADFAVLETIGLRRLRIERSTREGTSRRVEAS